MEFPQNFQWYFTEKSGTESIILNGSALRIRCQCRRIGFDPWVRMVPWRRKLQPSPVFLPGKSHGWGAWWARVHSVTKSWAWLSVSAHTHTLWWSFLRIFIATLLRKVGLKVLSYILKDFNRKLRVPKHDVFLSHSSQSSVSNNTKMWNHEFRWLTVLSAHHASLLCVIRILLDELFLTPSF